MRIWSTKYSSFLSNFQSRLNIWSVIGIQNPSGAVKNICTTNSESDGSENYHNCSATTLLQTRPWHLPWPTGKKIMWDKMAIFLVDLEFREKIKHYLTPKEILFVVFFLFFALIPWVEVFNFAYNNLGGNATKFWEDFNEVHCNPKFGKLCQQT